MRYTTIIDITEVPEIFRNFSAVRVYTYMVCKCGYHDDDRDILKMSYRQIAWRSGVSESACRHALKQLEKYELISRSEDHWVVKKWLPSDDPTPRPQGKKSARGAASLDIERQLDQQLQDWQRKVKMIVDDMTKKELQDAIQAGQESTTIRLRSIVMKSNETNLHWLKNQLKQK